MKKTKSMLEAAYEIVKQGRISFNDLVEKVATELEMTEEEVNERKSQFYTSLSLDQRFYYNGYWNLSVDFKYGDRKIEVIDLSSEEEDNVTDKETENGENGEEEDYDHSYNEDSDEDDSSEEDSENDTL